MYLSSYFKCVTEVMRYVISQVGRVLHKAMTGGLQNDDSRAALTAYIVISLLEADVNQTVSQNSYFSKFRR
jgi:hypothetical protein